MRGLGEHVTQDSLTEDSKLTRKYLAEAFERAGFTDRDKLEPDKFRVLTNMREREWVYCYRNLVLLRKRLVRGAFSKYQVEYEMPVAERTEEREVKRFEERPLPPSGEL
jgi:hypothetical protein